MIEKGKSKSMWMGIFGVALGVAIGIIGADAIKKNFLNKKDETAV